MKIGVQLYSIKNISETEGLAAALKKAVAFEGKTNGRFHIIEMGLSNEQVAEQLVGIYNKILR